MYVHDPNAQPAPYLPPANVAAAAAAFAPPRSAIPKVIGILAIIFCVFGLIGSLAMWVGPEEDLKRFGVSAADILNARETPEFAKLLQFEAQRARDHYEKAFRALPAGDRKPQRPGLIMAAIYRALLEEIERDGFRVLTQRTSLTPVRKFWIAWKTWVTA